MSAREYRDALKEFEQLKSMVSRLKIDSEGQVKELRQGIAEAESNLNNIWEYIVSLRKKLKAPFATKVDNELVFKLDNQSIQIMRITEE